jgi:hypothetical protein
MTITNTALPGHVFGGTVTISVYGSGGNAYAYIVGSGSGPNAQLNQFVGPEVFTMLAAQAAISLISPSNNLIPP